MLPEAGGHAEGGTGGEGEPGGGEGAGETGAVGPTPRAGGAARQTEEERAAAARRPAGGRRPPEEKPGERRRFVRAQTQGVDRSAAGLILYSDWRNHQAEITVAEIYMIKSR